MLILFDLKNGLYLFYNRYIGHYFNHAFRTENKYVSWPKKEKIDRSIWQHSFIIGSYNLNIIHEIITKYDVPIGTIEFIYDYRNNNHIEIFFKDEDTFHKLFDDYKKYTVYNSSVLFCEDFIDNEFYRCYSELVNPKNISWLHIVPEVEKVEKLTKLLIQYYLKNNYVINKNIFISRLLVTDPDKITMRVYAESDAMAAELSMLITSNNLAKIIEDR